jgi:CheY-like chemotaxis protein
MRPKVLLVDDDDDLRLLLTDALRRAGADVLACDEGRKALELMQAWPPALVLLDLSMSGMDGAAFRRAQRGDPALDRIPVIVITGQPDPAVRADLVLQKPFSPAVLLAAVRRFVPAIRA